MPLVHGLNHVAVMTADLDRYIYFYHCALELEPVFREDSGAFRHAILQLGADAWLHLVEMRSKPPGGANAAMFERGRLDHLALTARSRESFEVARERLMALGASDGVVEDLGVFHSLWFTDPDGMRAELALVVSKTLRGFHAPRQLVRQTHSPSWS